jgi:hypothetical protein
VEQKFNLFPGHPNMSQRNDIDNEDRAERRSLRNCDIHSSDLKNHPDDDRLRKNVGSPSFRPSTLQTVPLTASITTTTMSPRNPFLEQERNHFPDFEVALTSGPMFNTMNDEDNGDDQHRSFVDHSVCSGGTSSILNMSIGARAALNEHLRNVAKYGIDGEKSSTTNYDGNSQDQEGFLASENVNHILDEHWENLLDVSSCRVNSSGEAESFLGTAPLPLLASMLDDSSPRNSVIYTTSLEGHEDGIEVLYDVSHDFFNSSRVKLLTTPERIQNRRIDMVVTRDDELVNILSLGDNSFAYEEPSSFEETNQGGRTSTSGIQASSFLNLQNFGISDDSEHITINESCDNTAEHYFNPGNMFEVSRSPETSFLSQEHQLDLDVSAIIPTAGIVEVEHLHKQDSSFLSDPIERGTSCRDRDDLQKSFSSAPPILHARRSLRRNFHPLNPNATQQKENVSPDIGSSTNQSKSNGSSLHSAMSSFIEEAKSMASYVMKEVEQSFGGLETLPTDFFVALDIFDGGIRNGPPSPISQVESNNSTSQESPKKTPEHGKESRNAAHPKSEKLLTRKQRFRTIVPRRIYPLSTHEYSEEDQDSFLAMRSNPETQRRSQDVSLLESFEVVVGRTTF